MDPITHTLVGATIARAGLDRRTPLATAALLLGANAPDIDILTAFGSEEQLTLACRRGWTHGPLAMAALPFAVVGLCMACDRWIRRRRHPLVAPVNSRTLLLVATIGVLSHPALDWLNTYGIRLLKPFSDVWFRGDSLFIIDPWLWLILAIGLIAARRRKPDASRVRRIARGSGAIGIAYIAGMITLSLLGKRAGRTAAEASGIQGVTEMLYSPRPGNPFRADLVARTADAYYIGSIAWYASGAHLSFSPTVVPRGDWTAPAVRRARRSSSARNYLVWSQWPYVRVEENGTDTTVFFGDVRYRTGIGGSLGGIDVHLTTVR